MNPGNLHQFHQNLEALIRHGQAPVVRVLLRRRFLTALAGSGPAAWSAYGFGVARLLISDLEHFNPVLLSPDEIALLEAVLSGPEIREIPLHADAPDWSVRLDRTAARLREAAESIDSLLREGWSRPDRESAAGDRSVARLLVPVVAPLRGIESAHTLFRDAEAGLVIPLLVRVDGLFRRSSAPDLSLNVKVAEGIDRSLREALGGLEALGLRGLPSPRTCLFRLAWSRGAATLEGRSFELAFFIASAAAWSSLGVGLSSRSVRDGVAVTGAIDGERVGPVSGETLARKVAACFFSPVDLLCVPASQREEALAHVRELEAKHPGRQLTVRGVRRARDLWNDPAVVRRRPRTALELVRTGFRRLAMSHALVVAVVALLLLLGLLVAREVVLSRNLPFSAEWEGGEVVVRNEHGRITSHIRPPGRKPEMMTPGKLDRVGSRLAVLDLDGDRVREIVVFHRSGPFEVTGLTAFDRHGTVLWEIDSRTAGFLPGQRLDELRWLFLYSGGRSEEGSLRIILIRKSAQWATSFIDRIDGATGRHVGALWNIGHIEGLFRIDLEEDGLFDVCLSATHNPSGDGLLAVVRPESLTITAVDTSLAGLPDLADPAALGSGLRASFRFRNDRFATTRAHVREISREERGYLRVAVRGAWYETTAGNCVLYYLDLKETANPVVRKVVFTDAYKVLIRSRFPETTEEDLRREADRLARSVRALTPAGWTPVPFSP